MLHCLNENELRIEIFVESSSKLIPLKIKKIYSIETYLHVLQKEITEI